MRLFNFVSLVQSILFMNHELFFCFCLFVIFVGMIFKSRMKLFEYRIKEWVE
jgi:hypothetical protein